jgi:hypothetical protein
MHLHKSVKIYEKRNYFQIKMKIVLSEVYKENVKIVFILQRNFLVEPTFSLNRTPGFRGTSFENIVLDKYYG